MKETIYVLKIELDMFKELKGLIDNIHIYPYYALVKRKTNISSIHSYVIITSMYLLRKISIFYKAWWRNGSASDSRSEGCVFKSRPGHFFGSLCQKSLISFCNIHKQFELNTKLYCSN